MDDKRIELPENYESIKLESDKIKFSMLSDLQTGSLLRTIITSKPGGTFLELGTGTGLSLTWIVEAMDTNSKIVSIDNDKTYLSVAAKHYDKDPRVTIICEDGSIWIKDNQDKRFDLIFADAWPGKYSELDETLELVKVGGFYIIDDMLAQSNWPEGHQEKVDWLVGYLEKRKDFNITKMSWSTGLIIASKKCQVQ